MSGGTGKNAERGYGYSLDSAMGESKTFFINKVDVTNQLKFEKRNISFSKIHIHQTLIAPVNSVL